MAHTGMAHETPYPAEHQRSPCRCYRAAPVGLRPISSDSHNGINRGENPAQNSPARRDPRIQHPTNSGAHQAEGHPYADNGVTTYELTCRQDESLSGRVLRHVGRLLNDMKTLKMHPHRMCGIRQTPMRKSIGCK